MMLRDVTWRHYARKMSANKRHCYIKGNILPMLEPPAAIRAAADERKESPQMKNRSGWSTQKLVGLGLFTAIVFVLQMLGSFIKFGPFSVSLVLVPVVIGAALYGAGAGAWLGFVFGAAVLISGDAAAFLSVNALGTILTVFVKGTFAGLAAGCVYKALAGKNRTLAVIAAAVVCPVLNTGIFLLGCKLFFMEKIAGWGAEMGFADVGSYIIYVLVGGNFLFELLFNVVLSPVVVRLIRIGKKEV